ncbi:MAG: CRISPR-associated protein Cas4 [Saprospiraceae bacterium]
MPITATLIAYLHTCTRKLWLHANEIRMEQTSELVAEGRLIGETSYQRRNTQYTQIELDGIKIDFYDPDTRTVHETKRGRAMESAHKAQVQYYLYQLRKHGISDASGILEYPDLRKTELVPALCAADLENIANWEKQVTQIVSAAHCPPILRKPVCKNCSYFDLCYSDEPESD